MADILVQPDTHAAAHAHPEPGPLRFVTPAAQTYTLYGGIALGVVCLVLSFFFDETVAHTRFWSNWLHNSIFFLGVGFMALFLLAAKVLLYSGWHTVFKRVWEAFAQFLPVSIGLMLPIVAGVWLHWNHIYHWADSEAVATDTILSNKSAFLNPVWYTVAVVGIVGIWYYFAIRLRALSLDEDKHTESGYKQHMSMRVVAGIFLPIAAFSSAAVIWQVIMSIDAHWYSTMFAWYTTASWLVATVGLTIISIIYLKTLGYFGQVSADHLHDLGKYMFAFSIFWTYLWFSQFMLIWYGNVGEETVYFQTRMEQFPVLFWGNLVLNFLLPFFVLMPNVTKRKYGTLAFVAIMVVFGHWVDFFQMIKPGVLATVSHLEGHGTADDSVEGGNIAFGAEAAESAEHAAAGHDGAGHAEANHDDAGHASPGQPDAAGGEHGAPTGMVAGFSIPGLLEIGTFLGFLSLFFLVTLGALTKADLVPIGDPYLEESLHHHV